MVLEGNHKLTGEQNRSIFEQKIVPLEFADLVSQTQPTALFVGGQPGAGKTGLQGTIIQNADLDAIAVINGDNFRSFHPDNEALLVKDDTLAAYHTGADVGAWVEQAIDHIKQAKANTLVEGTLRNPVVTIKSAKGFAKAGYKTELHVVVAHKFFSKIRIFWRYLGQRQTAGFGRYTLKEAHDAAYDVLPQSLKSIVEAGVFDRIVLYTIEREVIFDSNVYTADTIRAIEGLVNYSRANLHTPIENLLTDVNAIHRLAVQLNCNYLVLRDIESLNSEIVDFTF
jgi:predicted ABC-type ATPase